ncbi:MAG TPA: acyl-CoA dehydrogenase family protein [Chloroflexota bacterium]
MDFELSQDQIGLRDLAREFFGRESATPRVRAALETGERYDRSVWRQIGELGLQSIPISEQHGGMGMGMVELALVLEEMGRHAYAGPYFASVVLAAGLIEAGGSEAQKARWLPRIASGELIATVAFYERDAAPNVDLLGTTIADGRVDGTKRFVPDAAAAGLILVVGQGGQVAAVEPGAAGLRIEPSETMDPTQREATVRFEGAAAEPLPGGRAAVEAMLRRAAVGASAEMLGAARRSMQMSVEYAKTREQFGQPIGSFQAVKHMCAEMLDEVEHSHAATYYAAWALDAEAEDREIAASVAKSFVSESARKVCGDAIQVHGGIGFTWEFDLHFFFKRAKHYEALWGDADYHRERVYDLWTARQALEQKELVAAGAAR